MSLKGDKYETAEEIKFRLENSVVLYNNKPVYICRIGNVEREEAKELARVYFWELPLSLKVEAKETRKFLSSRHFDLSPFPMGYMNHGGGAFFVSRTPIRQQRQGLAVGNTVFLDVKGRRPEGMGFNEMCRSPGFLSMVEGKYPSFAEAGDMMNDLKVSSVAISRSFAFLIDNDLEALMLIHRGIKCGLSMKGDKLIKVAPKFHFLREEMEECRIPVG